MIISRAPYRISFFGGGSDYSEWYERHGGSVLSATLDAHCYVLLRRMPPFLGSRYRVFWSKMETVDDRDDIVHSGVRGCLEYLDMDEPLEVNHAGDLPARSGLGSSSCFTVAMLHALHALRGDQVFKTDLAQEAIAVEQDVLKETVGIQDQIACAHGGVNVINIETNGNYSIRPIEASMGKLEQSLMLVFTGLQRYASDIAAAQVANFDRREAELKQIMALVPRAEEYLNDGKLDDFGRLLGEGWHLKRTLATEVSNDIIDVMYDDAIDAGALGGKLLGAGSGGFLLLYCPPAKQDQVREALGLVTAPVKFSYEGAEIIHS